MAVGAGQLRATKKYNKEHYDNLSIKIPKGERDIWRKRAEEKGMTLPKYIISLVNADLESKEVE